MKALLVFFALAVPVRAADMTWQVRIQYIEACSCDLFCPCYFNDHASHQGSGEHKCNFNNAGRILKGKYGDVDLAGLKFWLSGDLGADWLGGFFCPCHQSKFDLAGRVYKGVPAPTNLVVPPHKYQSDTMIVVGVGQDGKAA